MAFGAAIVVSATVLDCGSGAPGTSAPGSDDCYPDSDGLTGGDYTIDLVVNDVGFYAGAADAGTKDLLSTQNDSLVTLTLTNTGTKPHGFKVGCVDVLSSYPDLPAGCSTSACFPPSSIIAPIAPGTSATITFDTPTPDSLIYPFTSNDPGYSSVKALNDGQWSLM